jgi:hypothetical protein
MTALKEAHTTAYGQLSGSCDEWKQMANRQISANEKFRTLAEEALRAAHGGRTGEQQ